MKQGTNEVKGIYIDPHFRTRDVRDHIVELTDTTLGVIETSKIRLREVSEKLGPLLHPMIIRAMFGPPMLKPAVHRNWNQRESRLGGFLKGFDFVEQPEQAVLAYYDQTPATFPFPDLESFGQFWQALDQKHGSLRATAQTKEGDTLTLAAGAYVASKTLHHAILAGVYTDFGEVEPSVKAADPFAVLRGEVEPMDARRRAAIEALVVEGKAAVMKEPTDVIFVATKPRSKYSLKSGTSRPLQFRSPLLDKPFLD